MSNPRSDYGFGLDELKAAIEYSPDTGVFIWLAMVSNRIRVGQEAGSIVKGYRHIWVFNERIAAHRLAWFYVNGKWPEKDIDHINTIKHDNRIENLREATASQNKCNTNYKPMAKSGYRGVYFNKQIGKWFAACWFNKKTHYFGSFETPELARDAYLINAPKIHGEFSNFGSEIFTSKYRAHTGNMSAMAIS